MNPIVRVDWLADHLEELTVCHVGTASPGADPYEQFLVGHLPGARYVDLDRDLAAGARPVLGRHPLPSADDFAARLAEAGIADDAAVVAYDDRDGGFASRLVWMLRLIGQPAALLDGGLDGWVERGQVLEVGPAADVSRPTRRSIDWPEQLLADADDVAAHLAHGGVVLDARGAARYRGEVEPLDAIAGHIPGAVNQPYADLLVDGTFRDDESVRSALHAVGADADTIVHCGSGVTACHLALAMEHVGLGRPRLYVGSWSGWSTDPARPVATGPDPVATDATR